MKLLEPLKCGNITLKNRIMFPPLTTGYEERDGSIGKRSFNFYTSLARGGCGYIVIGDVTPIMTISPTPKLFNDTQIATYKALADEVHKYGSKLGVQIFYPEYHAAKLMSLFKEGKQKEALDLLHYDMLHFVSEVTKEELIEIVDVIAACAKRAEAAGVDVIEVHGDRLCGSLCSKILNKRQDEFGGSFKNRTKFALLVVDKIREVCPNIIIEYKLPIVTKHEGGVLQGKGGLEIEEALEFAKLLEAHSVNMIHVAQANHTGNMNDTIPAMETRGYAFMLEETKAIKNAVSIPVSIVGRVASTKMAEDILEKGYADYIAFGRNLLTDPEIANKLEKGEANSIRRCMMCNKGCTDAIMGRRAVSCVLNAVNGFEGEREAITKADTKKKVLVVGAGIAGLESARVLALRGHDVTVCDKELAIGGQINIACVPPRKSEMKRSLVYYSNVLKSLNVKFILGHEFVSCEAKDYDEIVIATGAKSLRPHIEGIDNINVLDSWDVLAEKEMPYGRIAVCGGGLVGSETAEYLASKGYDVSIIEMRDKIASEESSTILPFMLADFKKYNVKQYTLHKILKFTEFGVDTIVIDSEGKEIGKEFIACDTIVNALSSVKVLPNVENIEKPVHYVGDCAGERPSNIEHAVKSAYDVCVKI